MKSFHRSCHALRASPHLTACPAVSTEVSLSDSLFSSRPAWSLGLDVGSVLVLRCTCTRQRWILVPGHACVHAASAPRSPSVMSTSGAGSRENRARYAALDSCAHHCQSSTSPVCPSMAMIRHQPWPMYVPSAMTVWRLASGGAMRGRMRQHHAIRLRRARASPAESAALWDDGPGSQERNSSSVRSRLRRRCGIVELNRQAGHFHRWTPLPVRPFFFIARPRTGHLFALLDGVLTPSSPPPGAHHFPRDKNDRPTRLLLQGRAMVISTTKVPIGPIFIATPGIAFAANTSPHPDIPTDSRYAKAYQEDQETIAEINRNLPQLLAEGQEAARHDAKAGEPVLFANSLGTYGDILVSTLIDSGSVAFSGHAAIVSSSSSTTIESYAQNWGPINKDGVQKYSSNWGSKSGAFLVRPYGVSSAQFSSAAGYAASQVGKGYNWNFFDKNRADKFYCSQLVWRAWLNAGINTETGSVPNGVIAPADLVNSSNTDVVRRV